MKKIVILIAASMMMSGGAMAAANPDSNGVNKNCFGQGRSDYASGEQPLGSVGSIISERARDKVATDAPNQNVQQNRDYKELCQAAQ